MSQSRPYHDSPLRRVSLSLIVAVGVHLVLIVVGLFFLRDYLQPDPPTQQRLTQEQLSEVLRESPMVQFAPSVNVRDLTYDPSPAWAQYTMRASDYQTLPLVADWSWTPDLRPTVPVDASGAVSRQKHISRTSN